MSDGGRWAGRALRLARDQGVSRLLEEKGVHPVARARASAARRRWRAESGATPGGALPVWVVGLQRSGTNLLVRCLGSTPEVEVCSENDRRAFRGYRVRSDDHLGRVLAASPHRFVVFKPLCDAHRVASWLDGPGWPAGRALWTVRSMEGRTRSALARFGDAGWQALCDITAGRGESHWQAGGLSDDSLRLLQRLDVHRMSATSGAALLWYLRNQLYFELGLERRADVRLVWYENLVRAPDPTMADVCRFLGLPFRAAMAGGIEVRPPAIRAGLDVDHRVRALCDELTQRLETAGSLRSPGAS